MKTIVLGAGIAGLAYVNNADDNEDVYVYEKTNRVGGLCKSFQVKGFIFDSAVHLSFTGNSIVGGVFEKVPYIRHKPISYNYYGGKWIKHPVINNLSGFNTEEKCSFIESFIQRNTARKINSYEDWLLGSYGSKLTEFFYNVYTEKYWTVPARELSASWIGKRLAAPDLHKILYGAFEADTGIDYYAAEMRYPQYGGFEAFLTGLMGHPHICTGKEAVKINTKEKSVLFSDGSKDKYDKLVSSVPLCNLPFLVDNTPDNIRKAAGRLMWSKVSIVSIGFNRPDIPKYLWMYIYDKDILAARINSPSIKSPANVPKGCSSMQFEIYHRNDAPVDSNVILENVKYALKKMELCRENDIVFMDYRLLPYGNVIFYKGMENDRKIIRNYMESAGIQLIGRFGEWDYLWSDQSFLSGYHSAKGINNVQI